MEMKKIILSCLFVALTFGIGFAQDQKKQNQTISVCLDEMCNTCVNKINNYVAFEKGITKIKLDQPNNTAYITFNNEKTDTVKIRKAFEKAKMTVVKMQMTEEKK